jgi:phenylalanyl-tRNA synthetase alpha chain
LLAVFHMHDIENLVDEALEAFERIDDADLLEQAKARYLGRSGALTERLKGLAKLPAAERPAMGSRINVAKDRLEAALRRRREALQAAKLDARLREEALDVTLPGRGTGLGGLHPVSRTLERMEALFHSLGFEVADGPEIETDYYNFTALNQPENHPARSMHDTFYLADGDTCCARTLHPSRSATWSATRRRSRSSRRAASIAWIPMRRIRRCSIRWRACGSTSTSLSRI